MVITIKSVLVETYWSIGMVERYHAVLQRVYKIIVNNLQGCRLNKEIILQMAIQIINNTASFNSLVSTLVVFGVYPCISKFDFRIPIIS